LSQNQPTNLISPYYWFGCFRSPGSFPAGFAGVATGLAVVLGRSSTGITVALTLLFDSGATGPVVVEAVPASAPLVVSAVASAAFSSASVAAFVSCASSSKAAAFLLRDGVRSAPPGS
jgi:hypothetical protein